MARTTSARKTTQTVAKKSAARKPPAKRTPAKTTTSKPVLSLVKPTPALPTRPKPWMTDVQGYATLAARIVNIPTPHIRDWRDHRNGTATRALHDGSTLHYDHNTRTLTWQATCRMGAIHEYRLTSPSIAVYARIHTDRCTEPHADFTDTAPLDRGELAEWGIVHDRTAPSWAKTGPSEPEVTETKVIPLPARERALGDQLARAHSATADTEPLSRNDIDAGLAERAVDHETPKEHPEP